MMRLLVVVPRWSCFSITLNWPAGSFSWLISAARMVSFLP